MSAAGSRKMTHPSGPEITVGADLIEMFESAGWSLKSGSKPAEAESVTLPDGDPVVPE